MVIIIIIILGIYPPQALANAKHYSKEPSIPSEASCSQLPSEVIVSPSVSILQMAPFKHLSGYTCYTRTPHGKMSARINPKLAFITWNTQKGESTLKGVGNINQVLRTSYYWDPSEMSILETWDLKTQGTPISTITACCLNRPWNMAHSIVTKNSHTFMSVHAHTFYRLRKDKK